MSDEHRTTPHGWPVTTDRYESPYAGEGDVRVLFNQYGMSPTIAVCIAEGYEREDAYLDAEEAREAARLLNEAADILDAHQQGNYTPPDSTYVAPEQTPLQKAMNAQRAAYLTGMLHHMGLTDTLDGSWNDEGAPQDPHDEPRGGRATGRPPHREDCGPGQAPAPPWNAAQP